MPAAALLGAGVLTSNPDVGILGALLGAVGVVVCILVRDAGRKLEPTLWASWGGSPTVRRLRWRDATNRDEVERLHRRINAVVDEPLPTEEEERVDPEAAERRYDEAVAELRERTRDITRFKLLFDQNADYGFRRNSLGIRRVAIGVATVAALVSAVLAVATQEWVRWGAATAISLVGVTYWWEVVTPAWVRESAELYAQRLFEAVVSLRSPGSPSTR